MLRIKQKWLTKEVNMEGPVATEKGKVYSSQKEQRGKEGTNRRS
jgi:hypothetical protein